MKKAKQTRKAAKRRRTHRKAKAAIPAAKPAPRRRAVRRGYRRKVVLARKVRPRRPAPPPVRDTLPYLVRRRKPGRKRPVNYVGVRSGGKFTVLRVTADGMKRMGTYGKAGLKSWASKNGVKIR